MNAKPLKDWPIYKRLKDKYCVIIAASHSSGFQINAGEWYEQANVERRGAVPDIGENPESFEIACNINTDTDSEIKNGALSILKEKIINDLNSFNSLCHSRGNWNDLKIEDVINYLHKYVKE